MLARRCNGIAESPAEWPKGPGRWPAGCTRSSRALAPDEKIERRRIEAPHPRLVPAANANEDPDRVGRCYGQNGPTHSKSRSPSVLQPMPRRTGAPEIRRASDGWKGRCTSSWSLEGGWKQGTRRQKVGNKSSERRGSNGGSMLPIR